jgi:hypothetical protein
LAGLVAAFAVPVQAGNTSSNSSSNTSCNSSNGRTVCLHTHDWSVVTSGKRDRLRGSTRFERYIPERHSRRDDRRRFDDD